MMMTMTMDANLCKYGENLLEGSKICWDTYPAAQEVAHNDFGHDANDDDDDDEAGELGETGKKVKQMMVTIAAINYSLRLLK